MKNPKIVIIMPAYNAEKTLVNTYQDIPPKLRKYIILVDDKSRDKTLQIASKLNIKVFKHSKNKGYGANQKTCYREALKINPDIVAMLHPDYQYSAKSLIELIEPIKKGKYDFVFGSRISDRRGALEGGMPKLKYYTNRFFCVLLNIVLGVNFTEHFSGFRAYSAKLLKTIPFEQFSNDFVFDIEMTVSAVSYDFRIGEISIPTRYDEESSTMTLQKGIKLLVSILDLVIVYVLHQFKFIKSPLLSPKG